MPERIGEYEIQRVLGAGGMGLVYLGYDAALDRRVAIKVLTADTADSHERRARFGREARTAARLSHPNIAIIHSIGETDAGPYIAMELIDGHSWRDLLSRQVPLTLGALLDQARQVADALAYAHRQGVVHRDLKPDNVMVDHSGRARIVDFGLAKRTLVETSERTRSFETAEGHMVGTPGYMAPEQILDESVDHRADIFAFGSMMYEMLTGSFAFTGTSGMSIALQTVKGRPKPLATVAPHLPEHLIAIVSRCLEYEPTDRPQSMTEVLDALKRPVRHADLGQSLGTRGADAPARVGETGSDVGTADTVQEPRTNRLADATTLAAGPAIEAIPRTLSRSARVSTDEVERSQPTQPLTESRISGSGLTLAIVALCVAIVSVVIALVLVLRPPQPPATEDNNARSGASDTSGQGTDDASVAQFAGNSDGSGAGTPFSGATTAQADGSGAAANASDEEPISAGEDEMASLTVPEGYAIAAWEPLEATLQIEPDAGLDELARITFSPDGRWIARATDTQIELRALDSSDAFDIAVPERVGTVRQLTWPSDEVGIVAWTATRQELRAPLLSDPITSPGSWATHRIDVEARRWVTFTTVSAPAYLSPDGETAFVVQRPSYQMLDLTREQWFDLGRADYPAILESWSPDSDAVVYTERAIGAQTYIARVMLARREGAWITEPLQQSLYAQLFAVNAPAVSLLDSQYGVVSNMFFGVEAGARWGQTSAWAISLDHPQHRIQLTERIFASLTHLRVLGDETRLVLISVVRRALESVRVQDVVWSGGVPSLSGQAETFARGRGYTLFGWASDNALVLARTTPDPDGGPAMQTIDIFDLASLESVPVLLAGAIVARTFGCDGTALLFGRPHGSSTTTLHGFYASPAFDDVSSPAYNTVVDNITEQWPRSHNTLQRRCGTSPGWLFLQASNAQHSTSFAADDDPQGFRVLDQRQIDIASPRDRIDLARVSPDGEMWAIPGTNRIRFMSVASNHQSYTIPSAVGQPVTIAWALDSSGVFVQGLACEGQGSCLTWVGVDGRREVLAVNSETVGFGEIALSPRGDRLAWVEYTHRASLERAVLNREAVMRELEESR